MQAKRQTASNLVYWPVTSPKRQAVNMAQTLPADQQMLTWQQHMKAVGQTQCKDAFQSLYLHFAPKIKAFYLNQGMPKQAEELTHEVFIKIWQKAASYDSSKANVSTWIFTIVRNLRIDYLRKRKLDEVSQDETHDVGEDAQHDLGVDLSRKTDQVKQVFEFLNEEQRNVLQKVYFEDKSHQIAAAELEMTPGVVKSRIRSALKVLRTHMGDEGGKQ